jgi:hypothetical protein
VADSARARLLLAVRDEGIGMERELTGHVFDLFSQAQRSSDRSQGGLGLGLALVKNLVELHGGTVCLLQPRPGAGQQLQVELPLMRASAQQAGVRTAASASPAPAGRCACWWWTTTSMPHPRWACCWKPAATRSR